MDADAITFANMPRFDHIPVESDRKKAALIHLMFEKDLEARHEGVLHEAIASTKWGLPRQQLAFLIRLYCQKKRLGYTSLSNVIILSNGDINQPGLFTFSKNKITVNLLVLDDETLWRVYLQIPGDQRPKAPRPESNKSRKRPLSPVQEDRFQWVCCDNCSKWRRIELQDNTGSSQWFCSMHPRGVTCEDPEDQMMADETVY